MKNILGLLVSASFLISAPAMALENPMRSERDPFIDQAIGQDADETILLHRWWPHRVFHPEDCPVGTYAKPQYGWKWVSGRAMYAFLEVYECHPSADILPDDAPALPEDPVPL